MRKCIIAILLAVVAVSLSAEEAIIKSIKGKVEYSNDGQTWLPAEPSQVLKKGDYISTSFKSSAVVVVNDSVINVKALTRMTLDELTSTANGPQTELYLVSGKVQVEVKPSANNEVTTFKVKSAMATASVRGTGFEFDGENLLVNHGSVQLMDDLGVSRSVNGGEFGNSGKRGKMPAPVAVKKPTAPVLTKDSTSGDVERAAKDLGSAPAFGGPDEFATLSTSLTPDAGFAPKSDDQPMMPSILETSTVLLTVQ